jgi:hydrogenase/urease accessory protein HupE
MVVDVDVIEIVQTVRGLEGEGEDLVETVRMLPFPELIKAIEDSIVNLKRDTVIYFDGDPQALEEITIPSQQEVLMMLRRTDVNLEYRMQLLGEGTVPQGATSIQVQFPDYLGPVNLIVNSPKFQLVSEGELSEPYTISTGTMQANTVVSQIMTYLYQGFIHIIPQGLDHILFVLALFLLSTKLSSLLWQVTAFTVAHTITLIMATYGVVSLPVSIVEPLIAFSIVFVAAENIIHNKLQSWRIVLVFLFGLLHGLGFASVLVNFGLPQSQLLFSLISFNVGVELGQLIVIAGAFILVGWFRNRSWFRQRIILPGSALIALTGLYWTIERVSLFS